MNPCPCGFRGVRGSDCRCDDAAVQRYLGKLSGPLLDRIDLHVAVSRVSFDELVESAPTAETSASVRTRVEAARARQAKRFARSGALAAGATTNAAIPAAAVRRLCPLETGALALVESAVTRGALSARLRPRRTGRTDDRRSRRWRTDQPRARRRGAGLPRLAPLVISTANRTAPPKQTVPLRPLPGVGERGSQERPEEDPTRRRLSQVRRRVERMVPSPTAKRPAGHG